MDRCCDAVVHNGTVYCNYDANNKIYPYHTSSSSWSLTPDTPYRRFVLTVIDGLLTAIGGYGRRYCVSVLYIGTTLIAFGGWGLSGLGDEDDVLKTVEVLNTETREWYTAADLPQLLSQSSIALCGDLVYLLGSATNSVYFCSLTSLLSSTGSTSLGERLIKLIH